MARYFDWHTIKYSIRSLEVYMPWFRTLYIVTNGQVPSWLNLTNERVKIVTHQEIFDDMADLPTFSSNAMPLKAIYTKYQISLTNSCIWMMTFCWENLSIRQTFALESMAKWSGGIFPCPCVQKVALLSGWGIKLATKYAIPQCAISMAETAQNLVGQWATKS